MNSRDRFEFQILALWGITAFGIAVLLFARYVLGWV